MLDIKKTQKIDFSRKLAAICLFLIIFMFLAGYFKPSLIFSDTTTAGGDTGSHNLLAWHLKTELLPQGKIIGWYPYSFAGLPLFQYYFPLPYLFIAVLSFLIPFNIAFKLTSIMGVFFLPVAAFLCFRAMKFKYPVSLVASALSLLFLFKEEGIAGGGTIKSMLAGQFPYSISLALMMLTLGLIYKGIAENRHIILTALLIAGIVLCHGFALIPLMAASLFFVIEDLFTQKISRTAWLAKVFGLGFFLSGFWSIPYLFKREWAMIVLNYSGLSASLDFLITPRFAIPISITVTGIVLSLIFKQEIRRQLYVFFWLIILVGFTWGMKSSLLQSRYENLMFLFALMAAGTALKVVLPYLKAAWLLPFIAALSIMISIRSDLRDIPAWIIWNYEGIEKKSPWPEYRDVNKFLAEKQFSGRINFEYYNYNALGSPRIFELSPMFHKKPVMEGLLFESSLTYPFFFYLQHEISKSSWWPGFPIKMPKQDMKKAMNDLRLFNVRYFVARHKRTKHLASLIPDLIMERDVGRMRIYRVEPEGRYVTALKKEPVLVSTNNWKTWAYAWMGSDRRDVFLVFVKPEDKKAVVDDFNIVLDGQKFIRSTGKNQVRIAEGLVSEMMDKSQPCDIQNCVVEEKIESDRIRFKTRCVGQPHLIRVTYFPNWKVKGASRIYQASPSLMMVIPETNEVEIYYGRLLEDFIGIFVSVLAFSGVLIALIFPGLSIISRLDNILMSIEEYLNAVPEKLKYVLFRKENKKKLLILAGIVIASGAGFIALKNFMAINAGCRSYCKNRGAGDIDPAVLNLEDEILTGFSYPESKKEHDFVCEGGALCDKTRKKFVYVNSGQIRFNLQGQKSRDHILTIVTSDNFNCRSNTIFLNGRKLGKMIGYGENHMEERFEYFVPKTFMDKARVEVTIVKEFNQCYGFDISKVELSSIGCDCPQENS
ncbi:6-pyruvoyl-tetrahydropterin synthase-related protein [Desulfobacterales bacterium HSG16]|nr:6-pyruvoyl-tetrahydropterin synthase-related protein [Desulfobacterales bacterium HSG16]